MVLEAMAVSQKSATSHWTAVAKVTATYLLVGGLWILFSDNTLAALGYDVAALTRLAITKGWLYVLTTGLLLYWLVRHYTMALEDSREQLQESNKALTEANQALHDDSLTGLPNGHLFRKYLAQALAVWRPGGQMLAVLFIGLDGFKVVNNVAGHEAGDRLLCAIADRLRHNVPPGAGGGDGGVFAPDHTPGSLRKFFRRQEMWRFCRIC